VRKENNRVFYKTSGDGTENMHRVVVDLTDVAGKEIFIRLVDASSEGWGHINFDDFKSPNSYNTAITSPNNSLSANGTAVTQERIVVGNWDSTITNAMVNVVRFQWSRDKEIISDVWLQSGKPGISGVGAPASAMLVPVS
jgi:hypothetical protein